MARQRIPATFKPEPLRAGPVAVNRTDAAAVATIALSWGTSKGSFDVEAAEALREVVLRTMDDGSVRAIVLVGEGDTFCTGADVRTFASDPTAAAATIRALATRLHETIRMLHFGPKPVVTAVNGAAAGGGFGLALSGDVRIAATSARFRPAYFRIGLTPDGGLTHFLSRYAGAAAAQRIVLLDETLGAEEARALGLVHRVVPDASLRAEAQAIAAQLASWSPAGIEGAKALLARAGSRGAQEQMDDELSRIVEAGRTAGAREGFAAFLEKRAPRFP